MIKPFFENNKKAIVFSVDQNFLALLAVAIQSVIVKSDKEKFYDIIILYETVSNDEQNKIIRQAANFDNINIRFINISPITDRYDDSIFYTRRFFTKAAYYRLFIPEIFKGYDKVVYFDCDIVAQCDAAELFDIDLKGNPVAAARDLPVMCALYSNCPVFIDWREYINNNILGLSDYNNYFQSAVMIFDLKRIESGFVEKAIKELIRVKKPFAVEQCILNIMFENKTTILDWKWNYNTSWYEYTYNYLPAKLKNSLKKAKKYPKIVHFAGFKPYEYVKRSKEHEAFWKYAEMTEFFGEINKLYEKYMKTGRGVLPQRSFGKAILTTTKYVFTGEI